MLYQLRYVRKHVEHTGVATPTWGLATGKKEGAAAAKPPRLASESIASSGRFPAPGTPGSYSRAERFQGRGGGLRWTSRDSRPRQKPWSRRGKAFSRPTRARARS